MVLLTASTTSRREQQRQIHRASDLDSGLIVLSFAESDEFQGFQPQSGGSLVSMADHNDEKEQSTGNGPAAAEAAPDGGAETPSPPDEPIDEMAALRAELGEAKDKLLRERAELENYKKRAAREKADAMRYGSEKLLRELLTVIDNLDRATEQLAAGGSQDSNAVVEGLELVRRGFVETLERHGVTVVGAHGGAFDPALHEAIGHVESEQPANTVIDEHQRGYALHGRLLRPALVTVGKGPSQSAGQDVASKNSAQDDVEKPQDDG